LKSYKSPGTNQLLAEVIQTVSEILCSEIHKFTNSVQNKEDFPQQWKQLITVTIYKKGVKYWM
jgi:hypothetical protein